MTMKKSRVIEETLSKCRNIFGSPLSIRARSKIKAFLLEPSLQNWDSICGIVVWNSPITNIWTVVLSQDPTLDVIGRNYEIVLPADSKEDCPRIDLVREWEHIPSPMEVLTALKNFHDCTPSGGEKIARKILNNVIELKRMI